MAVRIGPLSTTTAAMSDLTLAALGLEGPGTAGQSTVGARDHRSRARVYSYVPEGSQIRA